MPLSHEAGMAKPVKLGHYRTLRRRSIWRGAMGWIC
jgi:hypothetical protein